MSSGKRDGQQVVFFAVAFAGAMQHELKGMVVFEILHLKDIA